MWGGALRDDTKNGCVADYSDTGERRFEILINVKLLGLKGVLRL